MKDKTTITLDTEIWQKLQFLRITRKLRTINEVMAQLVEDAAKKTD